MASHSGIIHPQTSTEKEEVMNNPFYESLRVEHQHILLNSLERDPPALVIVPAEDVVKLIPKAIFSSKKFAESHILLSALVPGLYCTVRGAPVEYRNDRLILTSPSDQSRTVASVKQCENVYDLGHSFKILVVDKPLVTDHRSEITPSTHQQTADSPKSGGGPSEYLAAVPMVETDFFEKILRLRKSFLLVPGYEIALAARIKDMSIIASNQVVRYLANPPFTVVVQADVERAAYATLHAWIYRHLVDSLGENKNFMSNICDKSQSAIESIMRAMEAPAKIAAQIDSILVHTQTDIVPLFSKTLRGVTPQQKINYLLAVMDKISSVFGAKFGSSLGAEEIIALFTIAVILANYEKAHADLAYASMFLAVHDELANSKASFAIATMTTCIDFLSTLVR
jgi:hypothetical protein